MAARLHPNPRIPIDKRFWAKVEKTDACWLWTGGRTKAGYGLIGRGGSSDGFAFTHRLSYEMHKGPIPAGLEIDHLCRVRHCVNPDHLEAVTRRVNTLRGILPAITAERARRITHCPQGHLYDEANTHIDKRGARNCRACNRERERVRRRKDREALIAAGLAKSEFKPAEFKARIHKPAKEKDSDAE